MIKKKYIVEVLEVHIQEYEVEASDEGEAIYLVESDQAELLEDGFYYSHALDSSNWRVRPSQIKFDGGENGKG